MSTYKETFPSDISEKGKINEARGREKQPKQAHRKDRSNTGFPNPPSTLLSVRLFLTGDKYQVLLYGVMKVNGSEAIERRRDTMHMDVTEEEERGNEGEVCMIQRPWGVSPDIRC